MIRALLGFVLALVACSAPADEASHRAEDLLARAEGGDLRAAFMLGSRFAARGGGEDEEALRWFRIAAEGGLAEGQYNLGTMYARGRGVARDDAAAAEWFRRAASQGMAEAQFNLASFYASGRGVTRDEAVAAGWYEQAAVQGLPQAQHNLGMMYEYGRGVPKDPIKALAWYEQAEAQGFAPAAERIAALEGSRGQMVVTPTSPTPRAVSDAATRPPAATRATAAAASGDGNAWLGAQDPNGFTLQLASFTDAADARAFVRREMAGREARVYSARKRGGLWHSVISGRYDTQQQARAAIDTLPPRVRAAKPWVRRFRTLQAEVARR